MEDERNKSAVSGTEELLRVSAADFVKDAGKYIRQQTAERTVQVFSQKDGRVLATFARPKSDP
jgi:hypothetical protein